MLNRKAKLYTLLGISFFSIPWISIGITHRTCARSALSGTYNFDISNEDINAIARLRQQQLAVFSSVMTELTAANHVQPDIQRILLNRMLELNTFNKSLAMIQERLATANDPIIKASIFREYTLAQLRYESILMKTLLIAQSMHLQSSEGKR